ncbi:uncharacterized protein KY384_004141 [Bacidia gigantensis]|uniref:uncharacterized protein n=1 Tax=Bacidia gigantensis TaxID=2732470 RepID=UPI001D053195|nr:uncharacterized protein KY384_004141 [Bacidia gigantensis]KAG8530784.1 hypothetical protein KY384_004141 [Bacidia gigantensis]
MQIGKEFPLRPNSSHQNFDSLPPAIQRKCFSSLERLRIAQEAIPKTRPATSHGTAKASSPTPSSPRPKLARRNSSYFKNPPFLRSRKASPTSETFDFSDAQWFQSLPPKLQRTHFTERERIILSGYNPQPVLADAADKRLLGFLKYLETVATEDNVPSLRTATSPPESPRSSISSFGAADGNDIDEEFSFLPFHRSHKMDDAMRDQLHCLDKDFDLNLASTLDDYHQFYAERVVKRPSNHKPSFRKVMSLSSIPLASSAQTPPPLPTKSSFTATATPQQSTTPVSPSFPPSVHSFSRPKRTSSHKSNPSTLTTEAAATYYHDPSTRLMLRAFASPQKFDEGVEFGYPQLRSSESNQSSRPSLSQRRKYATTDGHARTTSAQQTFLDMSSPSIIDTLDVSSEDELESEADDNEDAETRSLPDRHSPYTPEDAHFPQSYLLSPSATSQPSLTTFLHQDLQPPPMPSKPVLRRDHSAPLEELLSGNRDMTLKMTLTRPDLRAGERHTSPIIESGSRGGSKGASKSTGSDFQDPFALEQLPRFKDSSSGTGVGLGPASIWDTLPPVKESGLRKMWRKVSGKGY